MQRKALAVAGIILAAASTVLAIPQYQIIDLGLPTTGDTTSTGLGISESGQFVSGFSSATSGNHAFSWTQAGGSTPLPNLSSPARAFNSPTDINDAGTAAGTGATTFFNSNPLPVIWKNGTATQLALPAGQSIGRANGINNAEVVVGSVNSGSAEAAATFTVSNANLLPQTFPNGGRLTTAFNINSNGRIVGQGLDPNNAAVIHGFYVDPSDTMAHDIGALTGRGHNSSIAFGVASNGLITGVSSLNAGVGALPFIYDTVTGMTEIPLPTGTTTGQGRGVNAAGWVVGNSSAATSIPFLYDGAQSYRLQDLIVNLGNWDLVSGTSNAGFAIGNNFTITGRGLLNGQIRGFALVLVPEPAGAAVLVGAICLARRRRAAA